MDLDVASRELGRAECPPAALHTDQCIQWTTLNCSSMELALTAGLDFPGTSRTAAHLTTHHQRSGASLRGGLRHVHNAFYWKSLLYRPSLKPPGSSLRVLTAVRIRAPSHKAAVVTFPAQRLAQSWAADVSTEPNHSLRTTSVDMCSLAVQSPRALRSLQATQPVP